MPLPTVPYFSSLPELSACTFLLTQSSRYGPAILYQYTSEALGVKWAGGDPESGIADYRFGVCGYVSTDGTSDDESALLSPVSTHRQNYYVSLRAEDAMSDSSSIYYRIEAKNKSVPRYRLVVVRLCVP